MMNLNLLVLRCADIEASKRFYETLDMRFSLHAHGTGPQHYAHQDDRGVLELYPAKTGEQDRTGLGFSTQDLSAAHSKFATANFNPSAITKNEWGVSFVVRDPDGRRVEIKSED
jgi:lactoylglutathione lyase